MALSSDLEGIDRAGRRGGADIGLEAGAVNHVDGTIKQARDVILQPGIGEHGEVRFRIDLDHDVNIAVRPADAPRYRAEHSRTADAERPALGVGSTQGFEG